VMTGIFRFLLASVVSIPNLLRSLDLTNRGDVALMR
jgi:hypothetical protein